MMIVILKMDTIFDIIKFNILIIEAFVPFLDAHPDLKDIVRTRENSVGDWDFFMTVAGTGLYCKNNKQINISDVRNNLSKLDKQMPDALDNYFEFIEKSYKDKISLENASAYWVLLQLKNQALAEHEITHLVPSLGIYLEKLLRLTQT